MSKNVVTVEFVPLPSEKRAAFDAALRWLLQLMRQELAAQPERAVSAPLLESSPVGNRGVNSGGTLAIDEGHPRKENSKTTLVRNRVGKNADTHRHERE